MEMAFRGRTEKERQGIGLRETRVREEKAKGIRKRKGLGGRRVIKKKEGLETGEQGEA